MNAPLYDYLRGNWSVKRLIDDELTGEQSVFTGEAVFEGETRDLAYRETGSLDHNGTVMQATRRYLWRCGMDRARVFFETGAPFHDVIPKDGIAEATHLCGEDHYAGAYRFSAPDEWSVVWIVTGPRKRYRSTTTYQRA